VPPDVPAVAETLPGYEALAWFGIGAPHGTPAAVVSRLNTEINAGLKDETRGARIRTSAHTVDQAGHGPVPRF
jgi:tripartite-type tricarboxylate transporter receptor subunit TctC